MKLLDNFQQLGTQESSGVFVMGGDVDLSDTLLDSATRAVDGNPEGIEFAVRIQQASSPSDYMIVSASYSFSGGDYKLTVERIICSKGAGIVNGALVEFSTGADNLRFFGVGSAELINELDSRLSDIEGNVDWVEVGSVGAPAYENGWVSFDVGRGAQFKKVGNLVSIKGVVKSGSFPSVNIFSIPEEYRPIKNRLFATAANGNFANILVAANGDVQINSGGSASFTTLEINYYI